MNSRRRMLSPVDNKQILTRPLADQTVGLRLAGYSMTSSVRASSVGGIATPSTFAAFRFVAI